jgi:hypothetical protein
MRAEFEALRWATGVRSFMIPVRIGNPWHAAGTVKG